MPNPESMVKNQEGDGTIAPLEDYAVYMIIRDVHRLAETNLEVADKTFTMLSEMQLAKDRMQEAIHAAVTEAMKEVCSKKAFDADAPWQAMLSPKNNPNVSNAQLDAARTLAKEQSRTLDSLTKSMRDLNFRLASMNLVHVHESPQKAVLNGPQPFGPTVGASNLGRDSEFQADGMAMGWTATEAPPDFGSSKSMVTNEGSADRRTEVGMTFERPSVGRPSTVPEPDMEPDEDDHDDGGPPPRSRFERVVRGGSFEIFFAGLIILNTVTMCIEAEYRGWGVGYDLKHKVAQATTESADEGFSTCEWIFTIVFTVETIVKMLAKRAVFFRSAWDMFDFFIITVAWLDLLSLLPPLPISPMLLRLCRLVKLLKILAVFKHYEMFDTLFLMVRGIRASFAVLLWVVVLVFPILTCCALGMNYILSDFIKDTSNPIDVRNKAYEYYGTYTGSLLSMFEVTFASWMPICRFLYHNVDEKFAIFFMSYKLVMGIAVVRIIYGVFLHVTFSCAASDDEALIAKKQREAGKYAKKMNKLFNALDQEGDGFLDKDEFMQIIQDPRMISLLSALELEIHDAELVFDLTDDGDGKMSADEMAFGFSRLKGNARSVDILALTSLTREALHKLDQVLDDLGDKNHSSSHSFSRRSVGSVLLNDF